MKTRPLWDVLRSRDEFGAGELPLLTVVSSFGVGLRDTSEGRAPSEDLSGYRVVRQGDLVVNKLWARFGAYGVSRNEGIISPAYWVLRIDRSKAVPGFLHHLLRSAPYRAEIWRRSKDMPPNGFDIPWSQFRTIAVPLPGLEEQGAIADFLDRECDRISRLSERLTEMSALADAGCRERIRAELVGAGPVVRLRRVIRSIGDGPFGSSLASKHYVDSPGVRVIRLGNVGEAEFLAGDSAYISTEYFEDVLGDFRVSPGDVVVAGLGDAGHPLARACVVPDDLGLAIHKADCYRVRVDPRLVLPHYLAIALSFGLSRDEAPLMSRGATRARLNTTVARDLPVALPSLSRQTAILKSISDMRQVTRQMRDRAADLVISLAEYRDALITEAVTGQLDVVKATEDQIQERLHAASEGRLEEVA
ncbi:MAG: hypothetical protein U0R70_16410 [Solirubrobacteraceae bacterium]